MITKFILACAASSFLAGSSFADIQWEWRFGTGPGERGYIITDGNLVGGTALAGQYNVIDFVITQSVVAGNTGSLSSGNVDEDGQPGTGFTWDGTADTGWFRAGGLHTDAAYYRHLWTGMRYIFSPHLFRLTTFTGNVLVQDYAPYFVPLGAGPSASSGAYCFGDGSYTACPCGNSGAMSEGCANSSGSGALLSMTGSASVAADDLGYACTQLLAGTTALLFVGQNAVNAGGGALFGDGLRCAGGPVVRLGVQTSTAGGDASWGGSLAAAAGWAAGDTRYFQVWYRDPQGPCGSGFNLSNGVWLVSQP